MKRRTFLKSLAAVPALPAALKTDTVTIPFTQNCGIDWTYNEIAGWYESPKNETKLGTFNVIYDPVLTGNRSGKTYAELQLICEELDNE